VRFDERHYESVEIFEPLGKPAVMISFDRGSGEFVRSLTVRCMQRGRYVVDTVPFYWDEERTKADLVSRACEGFVPFPKFGLLR
jgi:hypothetical protein